MILWVKNIISHLVQEDGNNKEKYSNYLKEFLEGLSYKYRGLHVESVNNTHTITLPANRKGLPELNFICVYSTYLPSAAKEIRNKNEDYTYLIETDTNISLGLESRLAMTEMIYTMVNLYKKYYNNDKFIHGSISMIFVPNYTEEEHFKSLRLPDDSYNFALENTLDYVTLENSYTVYIKLEVKSKTKILDSARENCNDIVREFISLFNNREERVSATNLQCLINSIHSEFDYGLVIGYVYSLEYEKVDKYLTKVRDIKKDLSNKYQNIEFNLIYETKAVNLPNVLNENQRIKFDELVKIAGESIVNCKFQTTFETDTIVSTLYKAKEAVAISIPSGYELGKNFITIKKVIERIKDIENIINNVYKPYQGSSIDIAGRSIKYHVFNLLAKLIGE